MPKIFEYFGYTLYFYSNEHLPIHVHVSSGEFESKIEFYFKNGKLISWHVKKVRGRIPLSKSSIKEIEGLIEIYADRICEKWIDFFIKQKKVKCEKIKRRV